MHKVFPWAILVFILILFQGCNKKVDIVEKKIPSFLEEVTNLEMQSKGKLFFYIGENKIDYFSSTINDIETLLGLGTDKKVSNVDSNGKVTYYSKDFEGLYISYDAISFRLNQVLISSNQFPVEYGIVVGDSKKTIIEKFPTGFFESIDDVIDGRCYYYFFLIPNKEFGVGIRFIFNTQDLVEKIFIGWWSFAK